MSFVFSWSGRQLKQAQVGSQYVYCTYNDEGYRATKTYQNKVTTYYLDGSRIIAEETNGNVIVYLYDASGSPAGMQYHASSYAEDDWDIFWYEKNFQGDIVAVYSEAGTKLVSYTYDAWGNFTRTYTNGGQNTAAANNPFTYRGYYHDYDLGLYYLNSRYYDSAVGRFINSDSLIAGNSGSIHGYNLFAYCFNNPVNMTDSEGTWAVFTAISTEFNYLINAYNSWKIKKDENLKDTYSRDDAVETINDYFEKKGYEDTELTVTIDEDNEVNYKIEDSYAVNNRYDRLYVSTILSRTEGVDREASNISAEWSGHNAFSFTEAGRDFDMGQQADQRWWVRGGSKVLEIFGWW